MSPPLAYWPHLLRPWWLLALLALPLLGWLWRRRQRRDSAWTAAVDPHLLPALLQPGPKGRIAAAAGLSTLAYVLAIVALAGPAWRRPVPMLEPQAPLVVLADMSSHMQVADLPPTRALRERLKIQQLIALRKGGQLGLVAYAGAAFTVAPLSDDAHSLDDLVVALTPDTMPVDGQRADLALRRGADLLAQGGYAQGTLLLLSDGADALAEQAARAARARGYRVDVIGVGTPAGAPLPTADGTFARDAAGGVQLARLDTAALRALANAGGGKYAPLSAGSADLTELGLLDPGASPALRGQADTALAWQDAGPWLLVLLLPLAALGFRRGWLAAVLVVGILALPVRPVQASPRDAWYGLWQRNDQRADRALRAGDADAAMKWASTPAQRAAAAYRKGDFAAAAAGWARIDGADAEFNRGNALARMQRYEEAIAAWQKALREQPGMADAKANIAAVRKLLQQHPPEPTRQPAATPQPPRDATASRRNGVRQPPAAAAPHGSAPPAPAPEPAPSQAAKQQASQQAQPQAPPPTQQQASQQGSRQAPRQSQQPGSPQATQQAQQPGQQQGMKQARRTASPSAPAAISGGAPTPAPDVSPASTPASPAARDAAQQARADAAQRQAMAAALARRQQTSVGRQNLAVRREAMAQRERQAANEALLQRVNDDPGALLKRRFQLEYMRRQQEGSP